MVPQAVFTCMIEHRCMVPIIKWYYHSPDNSTIKVIKVTR
jgi:putative SOS response-associated peptidase YedK